MSNMASTSSKRGRPQVNSPKSVNKTGHGVIIHSQVREFVLNVREYFAEEKNNNGPILPVKKVIERTAAALKISEATVKRISREKKTKECEPSRLETPGKERKTTKRVTNFDSFQEDSIRQHIYSYYRRREYPTLKKLSESFRRENIFHNSVLSLSNGLKNIGFCFKTLNSRKILMERGDITSWRCRFLREIKEENFEDIVWLDETWINAGHNFGKGWTDDTKEGSMPIPIGKGGRLILLHAGSAKGFVPNSLLLFTSKKTGDYHEEMNHSTFSKWFEDSLITNLTAPSTIVMDNAPYHSVVSEKIPGLSSRKDQIIEWLDNRQISYNDRMKKAELLEIVNENKPQKTFVIDEIAKRNGHRILRLPPYHSHFNAIEMVWANIKGYVARNNRQFTITEVRKLTEEAISKCTPEDWQNIVVHTKQTILKAWENENLLEEAVERMIISIDNPTDSSTEDESEVLEASTELNEQGSDSDMSGVFPINDSSFEKPLGFEDL